MAKLTNQLQQTRLITSPTDNTDNNFSLDSEDDFRTGCRNISHQQQFFSELLYSHPDDHTIRSTDTPGFKQFSMLQLICSSHAKNNANLTKQI